MTSGPPSCLWRLPQPTEIVDNFVQNYGTNRPQRVLARAGVDLMTIRAVKFAMKSIACYTHSGLAPVSWVPVLVLGKLWSSPVRNRAQRLAGLGAKAAHA